MSGPRAAHHVPSIMCLLSRARLPPRLAGPPSGHRRNAPAPLLYLLRLRYCWPVSSATSCAAIPPASVVRLPVPAGTAIHLALAAPRFPAMATLHKFGTRLVRRGPCRAFIRWNSQPIQNYFAIFPKNFPRGGPPADEFLINDKLLRKELRQVQSDNHPDIVQAQRLAGLKVWSSFEPSLINKAYTSIRNPYLRAAHVIRLHHPEHMDITKDEVSKALILKYQSESEERSSEYKELLMTVLDAHESLEMATTEPELGGLSGKNKERMFQSEERMNRILSQVNIDWDDFILETIRLKYWVNIANGIKEWEPGKPVLLTH